jgi:serine beta-lactamase-like protein LACTB
MLRRRFGFLVFSAFLLAQAAVAQDTRAARVTDIANSYLSEKKVPGFTIAISENGKLVYERGFGLVDIKDGIIAYPNSLYRLASVSKTLTAMCVMRQVELGKVKLNDDIRVYVPSFPNKGHITVRDILCHESGIRHYVAGKKDGGKHYDTCKDALEVFADDPLVCQPETKFSYSTHAYTLLGALLEKVTGKSYDENLQEALRGPSGAKTPRVEELSHASKPRSKVYGMSNGEFKQLKPDDMTWKMPGGGTEATAADLCRVGDALLDGKILNDSTRKLMWTPQKTNDGKNTNWGLGWSIQKDHVSHSGSQLGAESIYIIYPEKHVVVVILSNLQGNPIEKVGDDVARLWIGSKE